MITVTPKTKTLYVGGVKKSLKTTITVKKAYITLTKSKDSIKKGFPYTYVAKGYGVDTKKITWTTTKKSIVVINKKTGKATAKSAGTDNVIINNPQTLFS